MSKTDALIERLASDASPVRIAPSFLRVLAEWLAVTLLYAASVMVFVHWRDDVALRLRDVFFLAEISLLLALIASCAFAAYVSSFPDLQQKRWAMWLPLVPLTAFCALMIYLELNPATPVPRLYPKEENGWECLACITLFSAGPAAWLTWSLRRQASTHLAMTGAMAMLAASTAGCLAIRVAEGNDNIPHLMQWHYLPLLVFAALGMVLGSRIYRW